MHPNQVRDGGWPSPVETVLERTSRLTTSEIVALAHRWRHDHALGPCPAVPRRSCREVEIDRGSSIVALATQRAGAHGQVRTLRAAVEASVHAAAGPRLLRAEAVLGTVADAAAAVSAAATAALLVERMSAANASLLAGPWLSVTGEAVVRP